MEENSIQFIGVTPKQFQEQFLEKTKTFITDLVQNLKPSDDEVYLTRQQVADLVGGGVHPNTIKNWADKGIIKEYGIGRLVRYKKSEVEQAFVELNN